MEQKYLRSSKAKRQDKNIEWHEAQDIKKSLIRLISSLNLGGVDTSRIFCMRSTKAKTRAYARVWGFSRIWQLVLRQKPAYIIEVISEKFDKLDISQQDKVLLHELAHIPRNFSGALLPHRKRGLGSFHDKLKKLISSYDILRGL